MNKIENLFGLLEKATSQFHTIEATKEQLISKGLKELRLKNTKENLMIVKLY